MRLKHIFFLFVTVLLLTTNCVVANTNKLPGMLDVIKTFDLTLYPGGTSGYYAASYKSSLPIEKNCLPTVGFNAEKYTLFSSIYYLLPEGDLLKFHATTATKQYHHYLGWPMQVIMIYPNGKLEKHILGKDLVRGQKLQLTVESNTYVAIMLYPPKSKSKIKKLANKKYAFIGCSSSPSWAVEDCTRACRKQLINKFPQHSKIIKQFT